MDFVMLCSFLLDVRSVPNEEGVLEKSVLEKLRPCKFCGMPTVKSQQSGRGEACPF